MICFLGCCRVIHTRSPPLAPPSWPFVLGGALSPIVFFCKHLILFFFSFFYDSLFSFIPRRIRIGFLQVASSSLYIRTSLIRRRFLFTRPLDSKTHRGHRFFALSPLLLLLPQFGQSPYFTHFRLLTISSMLLSELLFRSLRSSERIDVPPLPLPRFFWDVTSI